MYTASPPGNTRRFSANLVREAAGKFLLTLWNSYSFFVTYANLNDFDPSAAPVPLAERSVLDRWVLAKLNSLVESVTQALETYDVTGATRPIADFVDELSNWYRAAVAAAVLEYVRAPERSRRSERLQRLTAWPRTRRCTRCWSRWRICWRRSRRSSRTRCTGTWSAAAMRQRRLHRNRGPHPLIRAPEPMARPKPSTPIRSSWPTWRWRSGW